MCKSLLTILVFVFVVVGCTKGTVVKSDKAPDAAGARQISDGPGQFVMPADARARDGQAGLEDLRCSRSVNLRGIAITRPVPFDVVIVADNSDSLSWSRDSLSSGLKNLLARVHGHEARFYILTTTQYGASSQAAVSPVNGKELVSWRDSVTNVAYANEVTTYHVDCTDGTGAARTCPKAPRKSGDAWEVKGTWQFTMPPVIAAITPDMDDASIEREQKRIADAILGLGGGGSQQEQPLCTLLRYIKQDTKSLPQHAVFVVLTDEDDTSPPSACLAGYEAYQHVTPYAGTALCDSDCPDYVYTVRKPQYELHLDYICLPVDDKGTTFPERATQKTLFLEMNSRCAGDAGASTGLDCNAAELSRAASNCGVGNQVQSCKHNCIVSKTDLECSLHRPDNKTDICTQSFSGYANLASYCSRTGNAGWTNCTVQGIKPSSTDAGTMSAYKEDVVPLVPAKSTADMIASFKTSADEAIGKGNYSVETIMLDPAFSCPVRSGQSYGTNLRALTSSSSDIFPLCEDYAPALARIADFADLLVQTNFPLELDDYETVDAVDVTNKQGEKRTVEASGYRYDAQAKQLVFSPGVLTAQDDTLVVNVAHECHIIIR